MAFLSAIPISRKLPAIVALLCICASLSIAVVGYLDFQRNIISEAQRNFRVLTESRGDALETWFDNLGSDVASLGRDPTVSAAVGSFGSSYNLMIDNAGLQDAYITENPNPVGEKDKFMQAPEAIPYHFQHGRFHPYFRQINDSQGYYDMFLFNLNGDLVYSVHKNPDYATNFINGPYRNSGLAQAFAAARDGVAGDVYFGDFAPYGEKADEYPAFLATPVLGETGRVTGVVAIEIPENEIATIINNPNGLGETGELYVLGADFKTRSASRFPSGYTMLQDVAELAQAKDAFASEPSYLVGTTGIGGTVVLARAASIDVFDRQWGIVGEIDQAEVTAPAIRVRNKMIATTVIVAMLSVLLGWLTARSVVRPLARLGDAMRMVSERNYDIALTDAARGDEIGGLSKALVDFRDKLRASDAADAQAKVQQEEQAQVVTRMSTALSHLADGDLTHEIRSPFPDEYDQLRQNYNLTVVNLNETIGSVVARAREIRKRSDDMSIASDDLSRRTENQAATLEETAAALDELTASVRSAASGARAVEDVVANARKDAQESEPVVRSAVEAMTEIEGSSEEISKIIGVIDDIAFQTNLLALNAGVEAARAGDAGRGFAVVASEVRALAQRSSDAAKQIKTLISESSGQVERGVNLVAQAGNVLTKIAGHVNHISGLIGDIASGAEEQSTGLGEINIGVTQLDKVTQQNAAMVEQATAAGHALNGDSAQLADLMTRFRLKGEGDMAVRQHDNIRRGDVGQSASFPMQAHHQTRSRATDQLKRAGGTAGGRQAIDMWQDF